MAVYIDRESTIQAIRKIPRGNWNRNRYIAEVMSIPEAYVRPVVLSKWEWDYHNGYYYCSNCNAVSPREDQEGEYCDTPLYCHKCGAKMDLE